MTTILGWIRAYARAGVAQSRKGTLHASRFSYRGNNQYDVNLCFETAKLSRHCLPDGSSISFERLHICVPLDEAKKLATKVLELVAMAEDEVKAHEGAADGLVVLTREQAIEQLEGVLR